MRLVEAFPDGRFCPPATPATITAAESRLGVRLPEQLRALYLECDGFREPKGNAEYLLPLGELVRSTRFLWEDLPASLPEVRFPNLRPFVFFGTDGLGGWWGLRCAPPQDVIYWHHYLLEDGAIYESRGQDMIQVMSAALALYDEADQYDIA